MKIAFLDRDGTIINTYPDLEWARVKEPVFLDGSIEALKKIQHSGYKIIIITNQYLINDGIISLKEYHEFSAKIEQELSNHGIEILKIYFCPHNDGDDCSCKKPKPGMIKQAIVDYPDIDLDNSFLVGDSAVDIELAREFNLKAYGINVKSNYQNSKSVKSLLEAADIQI